MAEATAPSARSAHEADEIADLADRVRTIITPLARQLRQHANDGLTPSLLSAISLIYLFGIIGSLLWVWLGIAAYVLVAAIWLIPDRRMEHYIDAHQEPPALRP